MRNGWKAPRGGGEDIVLSTRVRLARNLIDYPFPGRLSPAAQREVLDAVSGTLSKDALGSCFELIDLTDAPVARGAALMEQHLISPEFVSNKGVHGLLLSGDRSVSIMVGEEDHLRIQALGVGLCPQECLKTAEMVDTVFAGSLRYAFHEKLGYLTKCPTNLGTGLRASVMLHLPAITENGAIRALGGSIAKLGFAVRGLYGEGSSAKGHLYQISNQTTLGFTEEEIVARLSDAIAQIIAYERKARQELLETDRTLLEDRVYRAAGTLAYARSITSDEAMRLLSDLRLGTALKLIPDFSLSGIDELFRQIQPAGVMSRMKEDAGGAGGRDRARADYLRKQITSK